MKLSILAVGKLKLGPEREIFDRYSSRIVKAGKPLGLTDLTLKEIAESRSGNADARCREESRQVHAQIGDRESLVLLDETGDDIDSQQFAKLLLREQEAGSKTLHFGIGGADGHAPELREKADHVIRFGRLTWPHQIVRILLAEQLYRAVTIIAGHPYHREG